MRIVRLGHSDGRRALYGRISCGPHWAIGMTGTPESSARRATPVRAFIGHNCGSRVALPSG
jgi:hypothetical protein